MCAGRFTTSPPTLNQGEAHVWRIVLDAGDPSGEASAACLSEDENQRAALFAGALERQRYVVARSALRHVLSLYHGVPAAALPMLRESGGRPYIAGDHGLSFSLTHSGGFALAAVARQPVGVDVERIRDVALQHRIARRVLHEDTVRLLAALGADELRSAFIAAWTQREAHVKALGGGIFRTPDDLPFALPATEGTVRVLSARGGGEWSVVHFRPAAGMHAALAAAGRLLRVLHFDWRFS